MAAPHLLPSCPHYQSDLIISLSYAHSKSGPVSCLFCSFLLHMNQNCFPPTSTIFLCAWSFGGLVCLIHPSHLPTESNKWDMRMHLRQDVLIHRSIPNTLVYPLLRPHVFLPLKRRNCLLFTLFSAPLCHSEDIFTIHIPQHTAWGLFWGRTKEITYSKWCTVQFWNQGN